MATSRKKAVPKKKEETIDSSERAFEVPSKKYLLTITINGQTESAEGSDLSAAVKEMDFGKITTKALIRLECEGKAAERWLYPFRARALFSSKLFAQIFFKQLALVLK